MSKLLAPNGKPSNLSPEQYKLVRTPEFKAWFGDWQNDPANASKVIDENGEPLVVFHGTTESFSVFNNEYSVGHYFTSKIEVAKTYSNNTISCFLDIKNPTYWDVNCRDWEDVRDGVENLASSLWWVVNKKESQIVYINKGEEQINMQLNCDGIIIKNIIDVDLMFDKNNKKWCADTIIVSSSNQIKLADGTNNTFDSSNPDIRFMAGGDTKKIKNEEYIVFREEYFKHLIAGELGNIKSFSEKNGNKNINDLAIKLSLLHQQQKAYLQGGDIINELYLLAKKIDENTGLKTSKGITYNSIIKRDIFFLKETHDKIDEEAIPIFNEKNPDIRFDEGGYINNFKYSLTFGGITIYTNIEQEYVGKNYSPFESKGSFKADIRKSDLDNIAIESEQLKDFNFQWGLDNWKSISQKLKNKGINKLELYIGGITKNYELKVLSDSENTDIRYAGGGETDEKEFVIQELDKDYKEVFQVRGYKNIGGSDFFFSRLKYSEQNVFTIELPSGKEIGRATLDEKENYLINIRIDENYRRKGLGLNLYNFIEYVTGKKLKPSPIKISQEAQALWIKRNPDIRFDEGGNLLLAPNGKPSNLSPEQYKLVRTPEFKAWFGDWQNDPANASKVVDDETKEPLVVYHGYLVGGGAGRKFYEFKKLPAFFSKTKKFAYEYASTKSMDGGIDADIDTYACFLNIRKLFDSKNKENIKLAKEQLPEKIKVSHGTAWFLSADIPKEEVIEQMMGIITIQTDDLLVKDILSSNVGDIIAEKVSASQYENKILLYKDEDWGYITDAQRFDEIVNKEIAEWVNNDYEKTIKYKGKYLKTFILIEGTYKLELNKDPLFLEFQNEVKKRKKYYIDNILKLLKQSHNLTITIKDKTGYPMNFYVQKINLKTYKTTTKNNWTMFENETLQKFLINNNFGGWCALERGDKTYGVYNANNIKLADGSNTTFDSNNNDIRFDKGGEIKIDGNIFKVKIYLGDHSYDRETNKETQMWFCRVIKMNGNDVDGILSEDNDLEGADIGAFDSRKKAKDFLLKYSEELNVILLDDYSIGVNVFSNNPDIQYKKGGKLNKNGDCYYMAGQLILNNEFLENKIDYIGTPYLVHAEVQGQGAISNLRYGHAWIEDDVFVYDYSNNRKIVLPKDFYYRIGDIKRHNPKKYRKYNFEQAKRKMLETKNYGCWDLEVEYKNGGDVPNEIEKISKSVVNDLGEQYSENDDLGKCKEISQEIAVRLNKIKIEAIPMRIIDGEDKKYNSPVFNHAYTFLPKSNQIIDTQIWQLEGQPDNLKTRKVLFNWDDYKNIVELYEVEPISDWENRFSDGGEVIINPTEIECHKCHWHWKVKDGGDDLFICHKCYTDNTKFYKFEGLKGEKILDTISYDKGGQILNLNKIRKGQYEAKFNEIEIYLTNPKILNGFGTNKWQLVILYGNDSVAKEWFDTKNEALKTGAIFLNDFLNSNYKKGGRTISQTPAPKKDQIKGSDKNKEGSAKDLTSAKKIKFADDVLEKIQNSVDKHNKKHSNKKITIDSAKAVVRRGMGAYSSTHRPTISGGNENSRVAWGLARLNAFMYKIVNGKSKSGKYSQDDDLINELGYKVAKYEIGGIFQGTPYDFNAYSTEYMGTGEGNQSFGWGLYFTDQKSIAERYAFTPNENSLYINGVSLNNSKQFTQEEKYTILNIWRELWQMGYSKTSNDYLFEFLNEIEQKSILLDIEDESVFDKETIIEINENAKFYNALYDKLKKLDLQINSNVVSVILFKGKNPNEYDLLEFNKPVNNIQINKIENQAKKEGILIDDEKELKWFRNKLQDGSMIYDWLRQQFSKDYHYIPKSADKQASLFLLRAGIDGIKYKSGTLSGFEDEEGYNYVIFDSDDVTIDNKEKYADGGLVGNTYTEIMYRVFLETETTTDIYATSTDLDEITSDYNNISPSDFDNPNSNYNSKRLESIINQYEFIGDDTLNAEDYIDDLKNTDFWTFTNEDTNIIESESVADINKATDEMINEIREFIKKEYNIGGRYAEKYMTISIDDEDGKFITDLNIRIADHSQNTRNNDSNSFNLSFVIANLNATQNRFIPLGTEYYFDDNNDIEDLKEEIKVIIDEKIEYIKENGKKYADGGDIQAYEEAMGISEFYEGGEAKPKKVYVSIRLDNTSKKIPNTFMEYFNVYSEKPFEELKNGKLEGLVGVSSSPNNIAEWFIHRDCLIVMDYDEFMAINETEIINYYDPYQLMKNNLYLFKRLYANITRYGEQEGSYVNTQTLTKILEKIIPEIRLEINLAEGQKYKELYRIETFLSPYVTRAFPDWLEKNQMKIESPVDLTYAILEFNQLNEGASYLQYGFENPVLTFDELLPIVEKGITNASSIYDSEQEIVLTNRILNIPKNSQLFFVGKDEVGNKRESNKDELIEKYNLKELYKVYFVDAQQIQKYRGFWLKKEEEKFNKKEEKGRKKLELKKEQVLDELLNYFLENSINYVKNELEKEYLEYSESLQYYDETNDDSIEQNLFSIPIVESIISTYTLIVKNFWKSFIKNKQVKDLNIYAFDMFFFNVKQELKNYFENKKDELEKLNNYRNTRNGFSLDPYRFERLLLKTIDDYEKLPELIDYKKLSKMYLDKMGTELYRYYDKKDLPLISQYKNGGSVLLAPNGKPSNLTPEQYKLVRTPAFKEWFGDWEYDPSEASKVVDENGEPLRVYHGTNAEFNEFDLYDFKLFGVREQKFAFFTDESDYALTYTREPSFSGDGDYMENSKILYCFLNIKNILKVNAKGNLFSNIYLSKKIYKELSLTQDMSWIDEEEFIILKWNTNSIASFSKGGNYDGALIMNVEDLGSKKRGKQTTNVYVALKPNQIKLADGTNTTFDSNNNDIRFDEGGETNEPIHFWGTEAGGVLVYCSTTERYLILLRSENVLEPNTWGIISGKLDDDETNIQDAVFREAEEETGHKLGNLIPSFIFEKPNFKFHNFVSIVNEEFTPELNWENSHYKWVKLNEMPDNLHFGLKLLLQKENIQKLVEKNKNNTMNQYNPKDEVTFNIPLLIRFAELMREDIKTDVALHEVIENIIDIKDKGTLTMGDYESMVGNVTGTEENTNTDAVEEEKMAEGGKVSSIKSKKGDIKISLDENWYSDDTNVELVPVSELIKFREFDRKLKPKYNQDNSRDNINHLKFMFQKDGVKEPIIIEYSAEDDAVLIIEGNHRINSAIDLGMEYLPARIVLKKYGKYSPEKLKNTMKVNGIKANSSNYIPSDLKPSQVGITGTLPITYAEGGIIEGKLHSECDDDGCGVKFQVGENGHIIEAERDEAVIVAEAFNNSEIYTIEGTLSQIASALNVIGGGKNFDDGAKIIDNKKTNELLKSKKQEKDTDVDSIITPSSIIINRRSMADAKKYRVTGTTKQIASSINSIDENGVVIEEGGKIEQIN